MENNQTEKSVFVFKSFIEEYLDVRRDKSDESEAVKSIREGVEMKGATIWILIAAILLASLGLNVNSTAVIIGAMLISPLMGPIMGFGLALGTNDTVLLWRALKNLAVMVGISILSATLYFIVSPLAMEHPTELLARTRPTIYDVLIAFFGGLAGIVETSRKNRGTVLSGVAIATALMPPLCTVGYGLATLQGTYFFGALYLFFINFTLLINIAIRIIIYSTNNYVNPLMNVEFLSGITIKIKIPTSYTQLLHIFFRNAALKRSN